MLNIDKNGKTATAFSFLKRQALPNNAIMLQDGSFRITV
jgi:hypothetical protein